MFFNPGNLYNCIQVSVVQISIVLSLRHNANKLISFNVKMSSIDDGIFSIQLIRRVWYGEDCSEIGLGDGSDFFCSEIFDWLDLVFGSLSSFFLGLDATFLFDFIFLSLKINK